MVPVGEGGRAWLVQRMFLLVGLGREERTQNLSFIVVCVACKLARSSGCTLDVVR